VNACCSTEQDIIRADVLMESSFEEQISSFCRQHCEVFEENDENKLEYMTIYQQYSELVEEILTSMVQDRISGFCMQHFLRMLYACPTHQLIGDLFDMLLTTTDFTAFKAHMLSFRNEADLVDLAPTISGISFSTHEVMSCQACTENDHGLRLSAASTCER
jgi:hypothetical protein